MFSILKYLVKSAFAGKVPGNRPVVVIESDDWGTIRMPSADTYQNLASQNPAWVNDPYLKYDAIESNSDIEKLFEVLKSHHDGDNRHPVITANCVAGNPDFEKIKENRFSGFFWEDFRDTLKSYPDSDRVYEMELQGRKEGIFVPQFHAREHIQTARWMEALRAGNQDVRRAFDLGMISHSQPGSNTCISFYMDSFNALSAADHERIAGDCMEGLQIFENQWGYTSKSLIAPCYYWHPILEEKLAGKGVKAFQGIRVQKVSKLNRKPFDFSKKYHFTGEKNKWGQYYFVRNCYFEPSLDPVKFGLDACIGQVNQALNKTGIAIISAHRLNFIGRINETNRDRNLAGLDQLFTAVEKQFPSVRYLSTADLVDLYSNA